MDQDQLEKTIDNYREQLNSLNQAIPNALLLTSSVVLVFVAGEDNSNLFILLALISFSLVLMFSLYALKVLKDMFLKAHELAFTYQKALKELSKGNIILPDEISKLNQKFDPKVLGKIRKKLDKSQNMALLLFAVGMGSFILGLLTK